MASVGTPEKVSDRVQEDGSRYVRVRFPCIDNDLNPHDEYRGPNRVASDFDVMAWANSHKDNILEDLALEEDQGILDMANVANPLTYALNPLWSTAKRISKVGIYHLMEEKDPRFLFYLEPLITYIKVDTGYTAQEIADFLDITLTNLLRMNDRVKAALTDIGTLEELLTAYDAEEGAF